MFSGRHVLTLHFTVRMEGDGGISDTAVAVDQQFRHSADKVDVVGKSFMSHEQTFAIGYIGLVDTMTDMMMNVVGRYCIWWKRLKKMALRESRRLSGI